MKHSVTIFGNLRINTPVRLEHMKSTFLSFKEVSDNWVINVRGDYREEAIHFLKEQLGQKLVLGDLLDDSRGWITNALELLGKAKYEYVLIWLEDHMCMVSPDIIQGAVNEMAEHKVDYMPYSWWMFGKSRKVFDELAYEVHMQKGTYISSLTLTPSKWALVRKHGHPYFLISMLGIFRKEFLRTMWSKDQHRLPLIFKKAIFKVFGVLTKIGFPKQGHKELFSKINRYAFFNKLRKYPAVTPFETEKDQERVDVLPFVMGLPNQELFACIDDDLNEKGYSLIDRGLYVETGPIQHSY